MKQKNIFYSLKEKKILQVLPALEAGGVTEGTLDIALALRKAGALPFVAASTGARAKDFSEADIPLFPLPLHSKNPFKMVQNISKLRALIQKEKINLVHVRSRAPAWSTYFACKLTKTPLISTFHGVYNFHSSLKKRYNAIMVQGDRTIAISKWVQSHILENYKDFLKSKDQVRLIHRGIDTKKFNPKKVSETQIKEMQTAWGVPKGKFILMLPGRLTRWKGQKVLLEALTLLKNKDDFFCALVGSDQRRKGYRQELEDFISRQDLSNIVKIVDTCEGMPVAYGLCDGVIHASTDPEAFGRVIAEAQAMGKPVIATNHGAPQEILLDQQTGWLVPPNDPESLARLIEKMKKMTDSEKAECARLARERVQEHFSLEQMCSKTLLLYQELLEERGTIS